MPATLIRLLQIIALPGVDGRIDHLAVDVPRRRLFVAALGNDTVEVIDLKAGRRVTSVRGLHEPQGVVVNGTTGRVFVANGESGDVHVFDSATLRSLRAVPLGDDADNARLDPTASNRVYVGYGEGAIAALEGSDGSVVARIALSGHPESFQMERSGPRLYVNVPSRGHIAVVDRRSGRVVDTWPVRQATANFPMALDEAGHRLFVGCRDPAVLLVLDTRTGKQIARAKSAATRTMFSGTPGGASFTPLAALAFWTSCGRRAPIASSVSPTCRQRQGRARRSSFRNSPAYI